MKLYEIRYTLKYDDKRRTASRYLYSRNINKAVKTFYSTPNYQACKVTSVYECVVNDKGAVKRIK